MKIIFAVALFSVTLLSVKGWSQLKDKLTESVAECKLFSDVDPELIKKALDGEFIEDPKHMKFTLCMTQNLNIIDAEGNFKDKNLLSNLMDNTRLMLKRCAEESDKEIGNGQKSFAYLRCVVGSLVKDVNISKNVFQ